MKAKIQKKHKAPKGLFGHYFIIIIVIAILVLLFIPEIWCWFVLIIILGIVTIFISHYKQRRKKNKLENKKK